MRRKRPTIVPSSKIVRPKRASVQVADCRNLRIGSSPPSRYNCRVTFRVRAFHKSDFDTLWRIDQACFEPRLAYSRFELAVYMRRPGSFTLVADAGTPKREAGNGASAAEILG